MDRPKLPRYKRQKRILNAGEQKSAQDLQAAVKAAGMAAGAAAAAAARPVYVPVPYYPAYNPYWHY